MFAPFGLCIILRLHIEHFLHSIEYFLGYNRLMHIFYNYPLILLHQGQWHTVIQACPCFTLHHMSQICFACQYVLYCLGTPEYVVCILIGFCQSLFVKILGRWRNSQINQSSAYCYNSHSA